jgi:Flp pilus assembly protein protease CpaA
MDVKQQALAVAVFGGVVALVGIIVAFCTHVNSPSDDAVTQREVTAAAMIPSGMAIGLLAALAYTSGKWWPSSIMPFSS